jgi:hypothetical protein
MMAIATPSPAPVIAGPGPGEKPVGGTGIIVLAVVLAALSGLLVYTVIQFWPPPVPPTGAQASDNSGFNYLGLTLTLAEEGRIFVIVVAAGALGGAIHSLRSVMWYVGNRNLLWSWVLMYCFLPFVGALLATIFYVVLRGGLLTVQTSSATLNVYGFAAVGALVGLFSEQAAAKLKDVFSTLFATAEQGSGHVAPAHPVPPAAGPLPPAGGAPPAGGTPPTS